jgi:purine-binding chemotaxis protein CheW
MPRAQLASPIAAQKTPQPRKWQRAAAGPIRPVQLITFTVGDERYGVDIMMVSEIKSVSDVALAPGRSQDAPAALRLHGETVPIIDLRRDGSSRITPRHVVIIVQSGAGPIGLLGDQVPDIVSMDLATIQPERRVIRSASVDV